MVASNVPCEEKLGGVLSILLFFANMTIQPAGRGPEVFATFALFLGLTTIATILRVYCRGFVIKQFALQDWLAVAAWVGW